MEPILSLCGMRCDLCLAYKPNVEAHPENRQILSDGWYKYFGFRVLPEEIQCTGCFAEGNPTLDNACPVRPCVIEHELQNCAGCEDYICARLKERLTTFEDIQAKFNQPIPEYDRILFIRPYENAARLAEIHKSL